GERVENPGQFDLILGSDILYERNHADMLARLIQQLAAPIAKVLISCPGRGYRNRFSRKLAAQGFTVTETPVPLGKDDTAPYKGRLLCYRRGLEPRGFSCELPAHNAGQGFLDQIKHHMDSEQPAQMDIATIAAAMGMTMLGQPQPWLCGLEALMESSTIRLFRDNQLIQQACALSSMSGPEEAGEWMLAG